MRKAHKNTITFNGRVYDAKTGLVIGAVSEHVPKKTPQQATNPVIISPQFQKPTTPAKTINITVRDANRVSGQKATTIHVKNERPKTLMRNGLKKPATAAHKNAATGPAKQPARIVINGSTNDREKRAVHTLQSKHIAKFSAPEAGVVRKTAEIAVKTMPHTTATQSSAAKTYNIRDVPPAPRVLQTSSHHQHRDIFEEALSAATSHKAKKHTTNNRRKQRRTQLAAGLASIVLIAGFFMYQNVSKIALARASSTIGFTARIPGRNPAGFTQSSRIQYQKGLVVINFHSNSDDRAYTLTQSQTSTSNETLAQNYLTPQNKVFNTTTVEGKTVYIYDGANATWINQGIWYTIEGNAGLSRSQLLSIVTSI